jgi:hypothetical protein
MTAVTIAGQPSPDWLDLRSARWERQADGVLLLDVVLANLGATNAAADVSIGYDIVTGCAIGPNTKAEVRAKIRYQNGRLTAESGDPEYPALVERTARLHAERCGGNSFHVALGPTGTLAAGASLRIRYRFASNFVAEIVSKLGNAPFSPRLKTDAIAVNVAGGRVFPASLVIENSEALKDR